MMRGFGDTTLRPIMFNVSNTDSGILTFTIRTFLLINSIKLLTNFLTAISIESVSYGRRRVA
ncbi:hypothetical protein WJ23_14925 [Burkholderia lata]|nr:hypothetical protein WJ23_14925 [Burkholderia lata]